MQEIKRLQKLKCAVSEVSVLKIDRGTEVKS